MPDPPRAVVNALSGAAKADTKSAEWVIDLDNFYQKQDVK